MIARWWRGSNGARLNGETAAPGLMTSMVSAFDILQDRIMRSRLAGDPPDALVQVRVGNVGMFEFHRADELIALGREAIRKAAAEIREHVELTPDGRRSRVLRPKPSRYIRAEPDARCRARSRGA